MGPPKHRWNRPEAGFQPGSKGPVGKCSNKITPDIAEKLLNEGIPVPDNSGGPHPARIANQYEGAIYVAAPTQPGISYHGYPWRSDCGGQGLTKKVLKELEQRAIQEGCHSEYKKWIKQYGPKK